jgi:hypothetical protein
MRLSLSAAPVFSASLLRAPEINSREKEIANGFNARRDFYHA